MSAFEPGRGHYNVKKRKPMENTRAGKTADDALPPEQRARVQAYLARNAAAGR